MSQAQKSNVAQKTHTNFIEQFSDTTRGTIGSMATDAFTSITGGSLGNNYSESGFEPDAQIERRTQGLRKKEKTPEVTVFLFKERQDALSIKAQIQELMKEIRREVILLEKQQKGLLADAAKLTVESLPEKPGIYHVRFLEWVLKTLRDIRKKVSESSTWLSMLIGKRKKLGYWGMFKKHGTSFGMSGERTAATQSG